MNHSFKILIPDNMADRIIYVLCYDDESEKKAHEDFDKFEWARVYRIPEAVQNHLFEGVMYQSELMKVYDEWKDKKYVGTCAYNMFNKLKSDMSWLIRDNILSFMCGRIQTADSYDFVGFMRVDKKHIWDHIHIHPILSDLLNRNAKINVNSWLRLSILVKNYYPFNYWMATPRKMLEYINYFNSKWLPALESHPLVWEDADYNGKLSPERLLYLTRDRCNYYPYHPFVNERLPSFYFERSKANMLI
jgi:hypothetical protein